MQEAKTILLIEDNLDIRENTEEILIWAGYKVITAENGKQGLDLAFQHRPDLIICDIMMPVLDGYGVLHMLQRNKDLDNTPFIFLTAKTERIDFRKGMEMGADDYITKPFNSMDLLNAIEIRLKKSAIRHKTFTPDPAGVKQLMEEAGVRGSLKTLPENRDVDVYPKKSIVYREGNHPLRLYYIQKGKVRTYRRNDDGKELVVDLYNAGDFLGVVAMLEGSVYKDTAEAMEDSEIAIIPKDDFEELLNNNFPVAAQFIKMLAKNVLAKEQQLLGLAYNSLRKKVAEALMTLYRKYNPNNDPGFTIDISRENLATIAGTATESLIRTLGDFRDEKLVEMKDGTIVILNEARLANMLY
ncbi:response regulator [uncultured Chitinophaga sp.]|uniref:response regulator n=1 Tax=uncultured Chitinophaga sp. TaxID=339340 RepID=UPI0025D7BB6D|nr:response regulator [uncultured Chitinophaga sp.]